MHKQPLTVERIVDAAARVADRGGLDAVSMRNIGKELGVEAMSLYHHIAGKEALLDALTDWAFALIELPSPEDSWRAGMVRRAESARRVLAAHPWALRLIDTRTSPGPHLLRHHDAVVACLLRGGFSLRLTAHAFSVIDAYVYGFALTEHNLPFDAEEAEGAVDFAADVADALQPYPHFSELVIELTARSHYAFADEFAYGLGLILDGLERRAGEEEA